MSDSAGRFHLIQNAETFPGGCMLTGTPGPVVDTGYVVPWYPANAIRPRLYLSVDVIRELADVAGVREVTSMNEDLAAAQEYNRGYMDAVKERVGDQLVDLVDRLGLLSALLGGGPEPRDLGPEDDEPGAGEAGHAGAGAAADGAGELGPSGRARGSRRRADVLGNPAAGAA